jgi:hypothetical protein
MRFGAMFHDHQGRAMSEQSLFLNVFNSTQPQSLLVSIAVFASGRTRLHASESGGSLEIRLCHSDIIFEPIGPRIACAETLYLCSDQTCSSITCFLCIVRPSRRLTFSRVMVHNRTVAMARSGQGIHGDTATEGS